MAAWGNGAWSVAFADQWRTRGEVTVPIVDAESGEFLRDTAFAAGAQNLAQLTLARVTRVAGGHSVQPSLEGRWRTRDGRVGNGWAVGMGLEAPLVTRRSDLVPSVKVLRGGW